MTPHQTQYFAWFLTRRAASDSVDSLASTLVDSQVELNPHQVEAALFACLNPLSRGVLLADEVGLGKTIEAGLVISQRWAERRRRILIIVPANLRKQWHQELLDKFTLNAHILESKNYNALKKAGSRNPFEHSDGPVICSYQFAKAKAADVKAIAWNLVVLDEAHRLRNVYKKGNVTARTLREALDHVHSKVLLTATPLQNSLLELFGLVSMIDDRVFGDLDSFRMQFATAARDQPFDALRARIAPLCKRTLRRDVQHHVSYTKRRPILETFKPSDEERQLSALVGEYLQRPNLNALPNGQRQLISLVLWKLLASSSHAIAGALETMAKRLQGTLDQSATTPDLVDELDQDFEALDETAEEWSEEPDAADEAAQNRQAIVTEVDELRRFRDLAKSIRDDSKGKALLKGLDKAFAELERLKAAKKALIFTESRRTQDYLLTLLEKTLYGEGIVLFNGTNTGPQAQAIYKDWLLRHKGTDRITGSKTADTRAALVEHFRDRGTIMIATEAGAEGINLQFCSLVINYDLPWNPQRIEQRIGRCHRWGQKHDVVVVNFVDVTNEADQRVYELLSEKFQLFQGVFGASDEVLGAIGSGVDFERRIADIYHTCRDPDQIKQSFEQLRLDLSGEISEQMVTTRKLLLENFDDAVHRKVRMSAEAGAATRHRHEHLLLDLTRAELGEHAQFDADGSFVLRSLPARELAESVPLGRYELPRRSGESHLYRFGHPLAEWLIRTAKDRVLPPTRLRFHYTALGTRHTSLEPYRGNSGWLRVSLLTVSVLDQQEQHLVVSAVTDDGTALVEDDPHKLLTIPAEVVASGLFQPGPTLATDIESRTTTLLSDVKNRNLGYFEQEVLKLESWTDDLKFGLEQGIREIDREIKDARRAAAMAPTLEAKLAQQKQMRDLETRRRRMRADLFAKQDEIDTMRSDLITRLEEQLQQHVRQVDLFTVEWTLN